MDRGTLVGMRASLFLLLGTSACFKAVPLAPTELDALARFLFVEYDTEQAQTLLDGVTNLHDLHASQGSDEGWSGALSPLDGEAFTAVGRDANLDTEWLKGVYELVPQGGCSPLDLAAIYAHPAQNTLFDGQYDVYDRDYTSNPDCFFDGSCDEATWVAHITDTFVLKQGTYDFEVQMRRFDATELAPDGAVNGDVVVVRSWMPEAAKIGADEQTDGGTFFDQSYTIETFSTLNSGQALHFYGLWNSGGLKGLDPDADVWEAQYVQGVQEWNDRLDALCGPERALWE